jgi:hypothetical protein
MVHMILVSLAGAFLQISAPVSVAQFKPCVFPNPCGKRVEAVAQFKPCVFPNPCGGKRSA